MTLFDDPDLRDESIVLVNTSGGTALLAPDEAGCRMTYYSPSGGQPAWERSYPITARQRADELLRYETWSEQLPDPRSVRQREHRAALDEARRVLQEIDQDPQPVSREAYCLNILLEIVTDLVYDQEPER